MGQKKAGIEEEGLVRSMAAMGGGIASSGGPCGALTGGVALLGRLFGKATPDGQDDRRMWKAAAEFYRRELAIEWLGEALPRWYRPCPISVKVGQIGAGGATTFTFEGGEVFGWRMNVQGSLERILDSVIPHEVRHTIFA